MQTKKAWYKSKGVWGSIITIAALAGGAIGYQISPEDQLQLADQLTAAGVAIGAILSLIGRIKANGKVGLKDE